MTDRPGVGLHELYRPYLWLDSYQHKFETFKCAWLEYVPMLRTHNEITATNVRRYVSPRPTPENYERNMKDVINLVARRRRMKSLN